MYRIVTILLLVSASMLGKAQNNLFLKGRVTDADNGKPIPFAQLASYEKMSIYASDSLGRFSIMLLDTDSVRVLALGYKPVTLRVASFQPDSLKNLTVSLLRMPIMLKQVDVYKQNANEHLQKTMPGDVVMGYHSNVPIELRSDVGGKPPIYAAVTNPMSFAYYHLSKREKQKRKMKRILAQENNVAAMSKELVGEITGLKSQDLDDFFVFCNTTIKITGKESSGYIRIRIIEAFEKYKAQHHEQQNN